MMKYEEPKIENVGSVHCDQRITHPCFAEISASRVSSNGTVLYGSDFRHQHYVTITISRSELTRNLSSDWPHSRDELINIGLSEAQWATFVSSLNGGGTQCTLFDFNGKTVPQMKLPPITRSDQFTGEMKDRLKLALDSLDELEKMIMKNESGKRRMLDLISTAGDGLANSLEFIATQFEEHIEETTEKAKIEVAAFAETKLRSVGLKALKDGGGPFVEEK